MSRRTRFAVTVGALSAIAVVVFALLPWWLRVPVIIVVGQCSAWSAPTLTSRCSRVAAYRTAVACSPVLIWDALVR